MFRKVTASVVLAWVLSGLGMAHAGPAPEQNEILQSLLSQAAALTASMTNVAQNLRQVDGAVVIETVNSSADLVALVDAMAKQESFGTLARVNSKVVSSDISSNVLDMIKPATLLTGGIATTAIGALQSGALIGSTGTTGTLDTSGIVTRISLTTTSSTASTSILAEEFGSIGNTSVMQNIANNVGDVNGSIQMHLAETQAQIGAIQSTAIGAMESGMLTASLVGNLDRNTEHVAAVVAALVGP